MPPASRRRAKKAKKKLTTLTAITNHHSPPPPPTVQLQGHCDLKPLKQDQGSLPPICLGYPYVVVEEKKGDNKENYLSVGATFVSNHSRMEGYSYFKEALEEETHKVESLSEDNKDVAVEVAAYGETQYDYSAITDVHKEDVSESVVDTLEPAVSSPCDFCHAIKDPQIENTLAPDTVEWELKEEQEEAFLSHEPKDGLEETALPPSEDISAFSSSVPENEASREPEVVETVKDVVLAEEEKIALSSVVTDVASKETLETTIPKSDESDDKVPPTTIPEAIPRESEKSWETSKDEKVGDVQEPSYESAAKDESFQLLSNVPDAQSTSVTVLKNETEAPSSTENQTTVSETQREHASWSSCCGIFEILLGGR